MAEQRKKNIPVDGPPAGSPTQFASPAKDPTSQSTPVEQRFDPMTGKEIGGTGNGEDKGLMRQFRSSASEAYESATTKASEKLEEKKSDLSSGLSNVASSIRQLGDNLGGPNADDQLSRLTSEFSTNAAEKIQRAANYFEQHDVNDLYHDAEDIARRNPLLVLGGAFAVGFLLARFLKSSPTKQAAAAAGQTFNRLPQQRPRMGGQPSQRF